MPLITDWGTRLGDPRKVIEYYEKALPIFKAIGNKDGVAKCYANIGAAHYRLGDPRKAIEYWEKALPIFKAIGDSDSERMVYFNLGRSHYESNPNIAFNYFESSIELQEIAGGRLVEEKHKISFHAHTSNAYQAMVPLCLKLGKEKTAFEYVERSKSRALLDLLAATKIKPTVKLTSKLERLLADEENCLAELREIQTRHLGQSRVSEPGKIEGIRKKLNCIYDEIGEVAPEYVFTRRGKPLSLNKIQKMLASQKNMVLLEYFTTKDSVFIFVVSSRDNQLHVETVPISAKKRYRYVENYLREVVNYLYLEDIGNTWLELSYYLIKPISKYLVKGDVIYFVPYGLLHYLPMHALQLDGEPLIRRHPVAYSPSASLIKFCLQKGSGKLQSCASFGVVFEKEADGVAELFGTTAYNGSLANKSNVDTCVDRDIIHFSCHGHFNNADPLSSGVVLYNEFLTVREIFGMKLGGELVTLSACETGLNQRSRGDELIGLSRAFIYAGAPSVVVSLWSVDAGSTRELMLEFYGLLKDGFDKASAMQEAQKKIMEKPEYSHPYYWAPFILTGDWQ